MTQLVSFAFFLALSIVVSTRDWRDRKIYNRHLLAGLVFWSAAVLLLLLNSVLGSRGIRVWRLGEFFLPLRFYPQLAAHAALSLGVSFALWRMSVWPAGDAKYFLLCSLFVGLIDPNIPGFPRVLVLILLINVFVPAGAVFALTTAAGLLARAGAARPGDWVRVCKGWCEVVVIRLREMFPYRYEYGILAVNLTALFFAMRWFGGVATSSLPEPWRTLGVFALMFLVWDFLVQALRDKRLGAVALTLLISAGGTSWALGHLALREALAGAARMTFDFGLFFSLARLVLDHVIERESRREVACDALAAGEVLSDASWREISLGSEGRVRLDPRRADGITEADAGELRRWLDSRGQASFGVYRTIPFAIWIFLGSLLSLTLRASVFAEASAWTHGVRR